MEMEYDLKMGPSSCDWFWSSDDPNSLNACLLKAAKEGNLEEVRHLLSLNADLNTQDASGWTPIIHAAFHGHLHVVAELLSNPFGQANVLHAVRSSGATAIHLASARGHAEIVNVLVQAGGNLNSLDFHSRTPLHAAILGGHPHIVRLLLDHKADPNICDSRGKLPIHIAQEKELSAIMDQLENTQLSDVGQNSLSPSNLNYSPTQRSRCDTESNSMSSSHQVPHSDCGFQNHDIWAHVPQTQLFLDSRTATSDSPTAGQVGAMNNTFQSPQMANHDYLQGNSLSPDMMHQFEFGAVLHSPLDSNPQNTPGWMSPPMQSSSTRPTFVPMMNYNSAGTCFSNQPRALSQTELNGLREENAYLREQMSQLERRVTETADREKTTVKKWKEREAELLQTIEYQQQKLQFARSDSQADSSPSEDMEKENAYDGNEGGKFQRKRRGQQSKYSGGSYMSRKKEWRWKKKD